MPIYEYRCPACNVRFERLQRSDEPAPQCPVCGEQVIKIPSVTGGVSIASHHEQGGTCCSRGERCDNPKRCCEH